MTQEEETARTEVEREHRLARTFVRLADTLVTGFDLVELFDDLVGSMVDLFDLAAAGLLIADNGGTLRLMASSSERSRVVELMELQADEGPCLEAYRAGAAVSIDEAEQPGRWPVLAPLIHEAGLGPAYGLPMRLREETIGALNIFRPPGRPLPAADLVTAQALADVATIATLQVRASRASLQLAEQLQAALNSRVMIEQAKGVLAERGQVDMQTAFDRLRAYARGNNRRLSEVAEAIAHGRLDPGTVVGA